MCGVVQWSHPYTRRRYSHQGNCSRSTRQGNLQALPTDSLGTTSQTTLGNERWKNGSCREKRKQTREMDPSTSLVRSRIKLGTNECTRVLESAVGGTGPTPLLILLAKNIHPPNILAHIPHLAMKVGTPIMMLPGKASEEMGKTLGVKRVAIVVFLPRPSSFNDDDDDTREADHARIDSFIDFIKTKIPKQDTKLAT